jgi:hypothetical protein
VLTNGTTPKTAPHAAWQKMLNTTSTATYKAPRQVASISLLWYNL